jgi:hypothetical protein
MFLKIEIEKTWVLSNIASAPHISFAKQALVPVILRPLRV